VIVFTKPLTAPEVVEALKNEGKVLLQVTKTQFYIAHDDGTPVEALVEDWFVKYNGRSHAYRDGSHVGGADVVTEVKVVTDGNRVITIKPKA